MSNQPRRQGRRAGISQQKRIWNSGSVRLAIAGAVAILIVTGVWIIVSERGATADFEPVSSIEYEHSPNHLHGIGYDPDTDRLYLATHFGLFAMEDDQLHQVGDERSDLMGFSMNPRDRSEIFVSGHPQGGGNLGLLRSTDEGVTFEQIFTGVEDETVDFHGMSISGADPDRIYGAFMGYLYRSQDSGQTFTRFQPAGLADAGLCWGVPCLAADSDDPDRVYAGMPEGVMVSTDGGETWDTLTTDLGQVAAMKVDSNNSSRIVAYTEAMGLAISPDAGETWASHHGDLPVGEGGYVFAIALDPDDDQRIFVATMNNDVFETRNGGETWTRVI